MAAVISEFLLVRSLPRHSRFMFRVRACVPDRRRLAACLFVPFRSRRRGAVGALRSLVHHSWVTREIDLLTLPSSCCRREEATRR